MMRAAGVVLAFLLAGCATVDQPPEQRTQTVTVRVPVPVPCFTEADRPVLAAPTPIDLATATTDQMAAALAADQANEALYARAVDALFAHCLKGNP